MKSLRPELSSTDPTADPPPAVRLGRGLDLSALAELFVLTLRQHARGRRLLILAALFTLPAGLAVVARLANPSLTPAHLELPLVFTLLPHALVPLAALLYASGMIQDEVEEQTLTYLLIRPLPRWALYGTKLLATWLLTALLTGFFTAMTYVAISWGNAERGGTVLAARVAWTVLILALGLVSYCGLFGCLSLLTRRSFVAGIAYIGLFEGLFANIDFVVRRVTIMYYLRVLDVRWLEMNPARWSLDLAKAPEARSCVLLLLGVGAVTTVLAALIFRTREFRLKTPEGS